MTVRKSEINEKNLATVEFSFEAEEIEAEKSKAYRKNSGKFRIPGFRPGKAPRSIIEKMYGPDVFLEDANDYLRRTDRTYDLIINDAYISNRMDSDLLKERQVRRIRECLNPGGVYMINLITAVRGAEATPGILEYEILNTHFKNTDIFSCKKEMGALERQNMILVGTDGAW